MFKSVKNGTYGSVKLKYILEGASKSNFAEIKVKVMQNGAVIYLLSSWYNFFLKEKHFKNRLWH